MLDFKNKIYVMQPLQNEEELLKNLNDKINVYSELKESLL